MVSILASRPVFAMRMFPFALVLIVLVIFATIISVQRAHFIMKQQLVSNGNAKHDDLNCDFPKLPRTDSARRVKRGLSWRSGRKWSRRTSAGGKQRHDGTPHRVPDSPEITPPTVTINKNLPKIGSNPYMPGHRKHSGHSSNVKNGLITNNVPADKYKNPYLENPRSGYSRKNEQNQLGLSRKREHRAFPDRVGRGYDTQGNFPIKTIQNRHGSKIGKSVTKGTHWSKIRSLIVKIFYGIVYVLLLFIFVVIIMIARLLVKCSRIGRKEGRVIYYANY